MIYDRQKHWQFLEDELKAEVDEFNEKLNTSQPNKIGLDISNYVKFGLKQINLICSEYWDLDLK